MGIKKILTNVTGVIVALGFSTFAYAAEFHDPGSCTNTGGIVKCTGVYKDMKINPKVGFVYFTKASATSMSFQMFYNNTMYACAAPASMLSVWDSIMASRNSDFSITLNPANGTCLSLTAYNSAGTI